MKTDWRAELEACDGFTEKQKGIVKAKLLAYEEQGGDTDTAFIWIKTALEIQSDGAEVSGAQFQQAGKVEAGSKTPDKPAQAEDAAKELADLLALLSHSDSRPSQTGNANATAGGGHAETQPCAGMQMPHFPASVFPSDRPSETGNANAKTGSRKLKPDELRQEYERMKTARVHAWLSSSDRPSQTGNAKAKADELPHANMQMPQFPASFPPSDKPSVTGNAKAKAGRKLADLLAQQAASAGILPNQGHPPEVRAPPSMPMHFPAPPFASNRPTEPGNANAMTGSTLAEMLAQAASAGMPPYQGFPPEAQAPPSMPTRFPASPFPSDKPTEPGNASAKTGRKTSDELAQQLQDHLRDAEMQRARLLASHQKECLFDSISSSNRASGTGGREMPEEKGCNSYIVRVLRETGWAWVPRSEEHYARWGPAAATPPIFPSSAMNNSTKPPSA